MKTLLSLLAIGLVLAGCAAIVRNQLDSSYGAADPRRYASPVPDQGNTWQGAKQVFDRRCVVCHGCYDAPCQLILSSFEGIARGASKEKVYEPHGCAPWRPTRLFIDAQDTAGWREKGFGSVLPQPSQDRRPP